MQRRILLQALAVRKHPDAGYEDDDYVHVVVTPNTDYEDDYAGMHDEKRP